MLSLSRLGLISLLALVLLTVPRSLSAASEDVAMFQEALAPYGQWLQVGQYGLVWRPNQVDRAWRPYTNGRWVLTQDGYVFETDEPWGWATYHYGNWQNVPDYGWVWIPGRTWYPHTVTWRSNDEHVGWAPVPPPAASANDLSWAGDLSGTANYGSYGYAPAALPASSWIFTRASDFLYGWGEPYNSRYSYLNAGLLAAPQYVPTIYERTVYIYNYVTPNYAPRGCFNWGPPAAYVSKVTHLHQRDFDRRFQSHRLHHLHNVLPPRHLQDRHPAWRQMVPIAAAEGQRPGRWWTPTTSRSRILNPPQALPLPAAVSGGQPESRPGGSAQGPGPAGSRPRDAAPAARVAEPQPSGINPAVAGQGRTWPERRRPDRLPGELGAVPPGQTAAQQPAGPPQRRPYPPAISPQPPAPGGVTNNGTPARPPVSAAAPPYPQRSPAVQPPGPPRTLDTQRGTWQQEQQQRRQIEVQRRQQEQQQWQAELRHRQQEQQKRQHDLLPQQQEQQQRQAVMRQQQQAAILRQQQEQQQRQAEMLRRQQEQQQHQAVMQQQRQQQAAVHPAPPPPPPNARRQKKGEPN